MNTRQVDTRVERIVDLFEQLRPSDLEHLGQFYNADARFKDPFNEVRGTDAVAAVFRHMFDTLDNPRFVIKDAFVQGDQCFLSWDFVFRMRRFRHDELTVRGASHLVFDAAGMVSNHRDYWDAAEELYEKLPVVGTLMRWLKNRASG